MRVLGLAAVAMVMLAAPLVSANQHDRFESGDLSEGETFEVTFDRAGDYLYHCTAHPYMTGAIRVTPSADTSDRVEVEIRDHEFVPSAVEVAPGTTVVWVNRDTAVTSGPRGHTVTEDVESPGPSDGAGGPADAGPAEGMPGIGVLALLIGAAMALVAARRH